MNDTMKTLLERRSVRAYKAEQVPEEIVREIVEAGLYAASGMGQQSPKMVVVRDAATVKKLSELNAQIMGNNGDPFYGAPMVIVVLADSTRGTYLEDGSLVMGNLMNAAYALGVDSCWIHRAKEVFELEEGKALKKAWGVPESYVGVGNCILGYHAGEYPAAKPRKEDRVIWA